MERNLTHIALFAALIAVLGLVPQIDLMAGVPITAQSLGIMLCGTVLGARRGALAVLLFLLLVAVGLPLLSGGRGGLGVFAGPSVGFCGLSDRGLRRRAGSSSAGSAPIGLAAFAGAVSGRDRGALRLRHSRHGAGAGQRPCPRRRLLATPFLAGDLIKAGIAAALTRGLARLRPGILLSRS